MRIAFIQDSGMNESAALLVLSSVLKLEGHLPRLFIENDERDLFGSLGRFDPGLIVIAIDIGGHYWGLTLASKIAGCVKAPLVVVGTYPTLDIEAVLARPEFRLVIPGECDVALPALASVLSSGQGDFENVPGLHWRVDGGAWCRNPLPPYLQDIESLPAPDVSLFEPYPYLLELGVRRFVSGRGCPNKCSYCYNNELSRGTRSLGQYVRRKSAPGFVEEIATSLARYPARHVHMGDDLFTHDAGWLRQFAGRYRRDVGVPFTCNATPMSLTEETVSLLSEAGCHGVAVGIESGDETLRERILDRPACDDVLRAGCERVRKAKILLASFNMIGMPGETFCQALSTVRLNKELGVQVPRINFTIPLRGTRLTQRAMEEGYLTREELAGIEQEVASGRFKMRPCFRSPDATRLERLFRVFQLSVVLGLAESQVCRLVCSGLATSVVPFRSLMLLLEKRFFGVPWLAGMRMFLHAGHPLGRTKNFNNFIP